MVASPCGIFINTEFPFLGATPDGSVYDPNELEQPYGYLEVKCPYSVRDRTPEEAWSASNFYCNLDSTRKLKLKETHQYFAQVQGQMAIGEHMWCDFVVYKLVVNIFVIIIIFVQSCICLYIYKNNYSNAKKLQNLRNHILKSH